jgi:bacteriocin biosynthesis cyclodehydratase domain-containing protein
MSRPFLRIKSHFSLVLHSPDTVELRSGAWNATSFTLSDDQAKGHLADILVGLDGTRSPADLAKGLKIKESQVNAVIDHLQPLGILETGPSSALSYYVEQVEPALASYQNPVQAPGTIIGIYDDPITRIVLEGLKDAIPDCSVMQLADQTLLTTMCSSDDSWLKDSLKREEIFQRFGDLKPDLLIAGLSSVNPIRMKMLNRISVAIKCPWLHAVIDGPSLLIGPFIIPGRSACYECFEDRILMNLRQDSSYIRYKSAMASKKVIERTRPLLGPITQIVASHIVLEALNFICTGRAFTIDRCLSIYLPTMEFTFNDVLRAPGCGACGSHAFRDESELYFELSELLRARPGVL